MNVEMVPVEVWVLVDEDGNYVVHHDRDAIKDRYEEEVGDAWGATATRLVSLTVNVPKPKPVELVATVAAEPDTGEVRVA